jgi:putative chitinase
MNRQKFFEEYRRHWGALSQGQVDGLGRLLAFLEADSEMADLRWQAYLLATAKHETADTFEPICERGSTDYFIARYWNRLGVRQALGNTGQSDAYRYCGRGYVQITGRRNYGLFTRRLGVDLLAEPDRALKPELAYRIASDGMRCGLFTGRRLNHYFTPLTEDWLNARKVINGLDRAGLVAGYGQRFFAALQAAAGV